MKFWYLILINLSLANLHSRALRAHWNYLKNGADWEGMCRYGKMQSPIDLSKKSSQIKCKQLTFKNYDVALKPPLKLFNNGHSVQLKIPNTLDGHRPIVRGAHLNSSYEAVSLHFHWGSPTIAGSEHTINYRKYDTEMHIVHKNVKYKDYKTAVTYPDGLLVLGIMLRAVNYCIKPIPGLQAILRATRHVKEFSTKYTLKASTSMNEILGGVNTSQFFTYEGSLTTPSCNEVVTWIVFSDKVNVQISSNANFWYILDDHDKILRNNYRVTQPLNKRKVIFCTKRQKKSKKKRQSANNDLDFQNKCSS